MVHIYTERDVFKYKGQLQDATQSEGISKRRKTAVWNNTLLVLEEYD